MARIHRLDTFTYRGWGSHRAPDVGVEGTLDNALDAGSTRIDIELANGGRRPIQVTDNGCGMSPEDAPSAGAAAYDQQDRSINDLPTLTTPDFVGEALPQYCCCSRGRDGHASAEQPEGVLVRVIPAVRRRSTPLAARSAHGCAYSACSAMCLYACARSNPWHARCN